MNIFKKDKDKIDESSEEVVNENAIEPVTEEEAEAKDDVPSVNAKGRDGDNSKLFKMMAGAVIGLIVILIGISLSIGKYNQSQEEKKAKDAEKIANNQKEVTKGNNVDINADLQNMQNLPPPNFDDDVVEEENEQASAINPTPTPVESIVEPMPAPQYDSYSNNNMVAGRDYEPPAPIEPVQPVQPQIQTVVQEVVKEPEPSPILVDIYGEKSLSASAQQKETGLANSLRSSKIADGSATKSSNKNMLLARGTVIPCVLITKINSTYQGFTTCHLAKDVYSANGKTLLLERGSTVFGEQNVQITQGKARVAVLWSKIETPNGVSINIDSPATGQLGEMGIGAKVNNHFWKRFGGAIMLSTIQDALAIGRSHLEKKIAKAKQPILIIQQALLIVWLKKY